MDDCPKKQELSEYLRGTLPLSQADRLAEHLESCQACGSTIETLERNGTDDTLLEKLRTPAPAAPYGEAPDVREALARVSAMVDDRRPQPAASADPALRESEPLPQLGEYELLAKLGEGGMGAVYRARHTKLDKLVALKVLPKDRMQNPTAVARFEREMKAVGRLNHPHIVQAHDAREIDGTHFLAMEYVEGLDLAGLVSATGPLRIEDACELVRQTAIGLQHAHEQGLVHRDIKPSNLMLSRQGIVKILDLGLALLGTNQPDRPEMTAAGTAMGTADYVSPEQVTDSHSVDIRSDIYSLGCTLYKLLTGQAPFGGPEYKNNVTKMMAHMQQTPPPVSRLRTDLPQGLAEVIDRMMAKNPGERFATPGEVAAALEPFAAGCDLGHVLNEAHGVLGLPAVEPPRSASTGKLSGSGRAETAVPERVATLPGKAIGRSGLAPERRPRRFVPRQLLIAGGAALGLVCAVFLAAQVIIRITHKDGQVTEVHVPPGAKVEIVEHEKTPTGQPAQAADSGRPAGKPALHAAQADKAKPFVLLRNGTQAGEFKGLGGALAALQAGDEVVVHGNGPFTATATRLDAGLTLRAAPGYRPKFMVDKLEPNRPWLEVRGPLRVEGCDFATSEFACLFSGGEGPCEFLSCGCYSSAIGSSSSGQLVSWREAPAVRVRNCMLVNLEVRVHGVPEVELTNNIACFPGGRVLGAQLVQRIHLLQNTFAAGIHGEIGAVLTCQPPDNSQRLVTQVEAVGNIFYSTYLVTFEAPQGTPLKDHLAWQGRENLYVGAFNFHDWTHKDDPGKSHWSFTAKDFAAWKNLWGGEEGSQAVDRVAFQVAKFCRGTPDEALNWIRQRSETIRQQLGNKALDCGPKWELIGPGEAYVRALAANGKPVPQDQLRPEELEGGPFVLIRKGQTDRGYVKLQEAADAARSGDLIEVRTDGPIGDCQFVAPSGPVAITLRAAPGYRPVVSQIYSEQSVRLTVEGLHFRNGQLFLQRMKEGCGLARVANCSFEGDGVLAATYWASDGGAMEIQNCLIPCGLATSRESVNDTTRLEISNCVLGPIRSGGIERALPIVLRQCIVESQGFMECRWLTGGPYCFGGWTDTVAERTLFDNAGGLVERPHQSCKGTGNIYALFCGRTLEELRTQGKSPEEGSLEADPLVLDPRSWQLLPSSPGYRQGPGGRDFGADVSKVAGALEPRTADGTPDQPSAPSVGDADRRAAEWVLSLGGYGNMITIRVGDQEKNISAAKDLPAGVWQLVKVELRDKGTDAGLKNFKGLANLTGLMLYGPGVTDAGLVNLQGLPSLQGLLLHGTSVSDAGLEHLKSLPNLQSLQLQRSRIGDVVNGNRVGDAGLKHLQGLTRLSHLELLGQPVTDAGLEHLASLTNLANLELSGTSVSDAGLKGLKGLTNLVFLGLDGTSIGDAGLEHLQGLPKLANLNLRGTRVSDAGLPSLVSLPIYRLQLEDARVSAKGFANLKATWPSADIQWSERNRTAAEAVLAAGGKLSVRPKGQQDHRPIKAVGELPAEYFQVTRVSLANASKTPEDLVGKLTALKDPDFDSLEVLDLSGQPIQNWSRLAGFSHLADLSLARTNVNDPGLEALKSLKELRRLFLDACPINGTGLQHLKDLPNLTELRLGCPALTDLGMASFAQMKHLERLSLAGSGVSDEGLKHLQGLANLKELDLSQTKVTNAGLAELQKALPRCRVLAEPAAASAEQGRKGSSGNGDQFNPDRPEIY